MNYAALLEHSYEMAMGDECPPQSRLDFLGEHVFDFTTYDSSMSELFANKAVTVCAAITDGKTFDCIEDPEHYRWYLLMVNMPFFAGRLDWGSSIRGAWWSHTMPPIESCGLYAGTEQVLHLDMSDQREWRNFVGAVIAFASPLSSDGKLTDPSGG